MKILTYSLNKISKRSFLLSTEICIQFRNDQSDIN